MLANAMSASAMWAANAATVSPAPYTTDGRSHLTVANLVTMAHRSHEWLSTLAQLRLAFADQRHFAVHAPVPPPFGDEGAANHMRMAVAHDAPGVEIFVRSEEHTSELQSLMRISYAVFCLKQKKTQQNQPTDKKT